MPIKIALSDTRLRGYLLLSLLLIGAMAAFLLWPKGERQPLQVVVDSAYLNGDTTGSSRYYSYEKQRPRGYEKRYGGGKKHRTEGNTFNPQPINPQPFNPQPINPQSPQTENPQPVARQHSQADTVAPRYAQPYRRQSLTIDLNSADSVELQLLSGIGPAYARRIIRYRERLGGFVSLNQLLEVYGFTPELLERIEPFLTLTTPNAKSLKVNQLTVKELSKHPYLEYDQASDIVRYRQKGHTFTTQHDLLLLPSFDQATLERIAPYLDLNN